MFGMASRAFFSSGRRSMVATLRRSSAGCPGQREQIRLRWRKRGQDVQQIAFALGGAENFVHIVSSDRGLLQQKAQTRSSLPDEEDDFKCAFNWRAQSPAL